MELPFINGIKLIKQSRSSIEIRKITKSLNEFAEIATVYQSLVGQNTSFCRPELELRVFIDRTLALFVKKVPDETKEKILKDIVHYLKESLDIVYWRY